MVKLFSLPLYVIDRDGWDKRVTIIEHGDFGGSGHSWSFGTKSTSSIECILDNGLVSKVII